jgi:hypothetical protein
MTIKHLTPKTSKELIKVLRKCHLAKQLIEACSTNKQIFDLVIDFLNIPADDILITPQIHDLRVSQLNHLFIAFYSYGKNDE